MPAVFSQHRPKRGLPFTAHGQNCTMTGVQPQSVKQRRGTFNILPWGWGVTAMESGQLPSEQDGPQTPVTASKLCLGQGDS